MTSHTLTDTVQLAERIETSSSDVVGCGLASKPISGLSQDAVSKAMLTAMHNQAGCTAGHGHRRVGVLEQDLRYEVLSVPEGCASTRSFAEDKHGGHLARHRHEHGLEWRDDVESHFRV